MIEYLDGLLERKSPTEAVIECHGVGYRVSISLSTFSALPASGRVRLLVQPHYSETDQKLYGFVEAGERELFRLLQSVRGVGPATALAILSHETPAAIARRIQSEDVRGLMSIKGIGRKTAERLLVELKDKVALAEAPRPGGRPSLESELATALQNLGLAPQEAARRARHAAATAPAESRIEDLLRRSLRLADEDSARRAGA